MKGTQERTFTNKQLELISLWRTNNLKRINVLEGAVRSGKTWISLVIWGLWVWSMPENGNYLMAAKTLTSLRRNCLDLLQELVGVSNFTYSIAAKEAQLFGRRVYLEGANDARSENKIRGMTLQGAYCDEVTLFTEDFFTMLLSRLSEPQAKLFCTTNPDRPTHWLKEKFLDREEELDLLDMRFLLTDNTFLSSEYVDSLMREYTGVYRERLIEGNWSLAEGLVYPHANEVIVPTEDRLYTEYAVSCDYGIYNPFGILLFGVCDGVHYAIKEYYHSGRESNQPKTDNEYLQELVKFIGKTPIRRIIIDPSASSFITLLRRETKFAIMQADNAVLDGIRNTATAFSKNLLKINDCCTHFIRELNSYAWDSNSRDGDKPIKESDHLCDCCRYYVRTNKIVVPKRSSLF